MRLGRACGLALTSSFVQRLDMTMYSVFCIPQGDSEYRIHTEYALASQQHSEGCAISPPRAPQLATLGALASQHSEEVWHTPELHHSSAIQEQPAQPQSMLSLSAGAPCTLLTMFCGQGEDEDDDGYGYGGEMMTDTRPLRARAHRPRQNTEYRIHCHVKPLQSPCGT